MQQKWDNIDRIISSSAEDIEPSYNYNKKLMNKLHKRESKSSNMFKFGFESRRIAAASLIIAGVLMMVIFNTDLQYSLLETHYKIKAQVMLLQNRYSYETNEIFDYIGE